MILAMFPDLLFIGIFWLVAIAMPASRTWRFVAFMLITTILFFVSGDAGDLARPVRATLVVLWTVALLRPDVLGIGALSKAEHAFDEKLRRVEQEAIALSNDGDETGRLRAAIKELQSLTAPTPAWEHIRELVVADVSVMRRSPVSQGGAKVNPLSTEARGAWRATRTRRVLQLPAIRLPRP